MVIINLDSKAEVLSEAMGGECEITLRDYNKK